VQREKRYFLTGASGVVGSALVPLLLEDPDTQITLLLRAASPGDLAQRLEQLLRFWAIGPQDAARRERVAALRGDVTASRFALPDGEFRALAGSCTHIVHCAGDLRMDLPIADARQAAVGSAGNIVALARECQAGANLRKVEFVSSVGVGGRMPRVPEQWLSEPRVFHNTYEQAKAEAETLIREQMDRHGLPLTLHRPSMVVGDSRTGRVIHRQIFHDLCEFLSGEQTRGVLPALTGITLDTVPVDYVARAIRWSSTQGETLGRVLHLCSGPELAMSIDWLAGELRKALLAHGRRPPRPKRVPLWVFTRVLPAVATLAPPALRKAARDGGLYLDYASDRQVFENGQSGALLAAAGMPVPVPADYMGRVLASYIGETHT
jgi:UDP-glucose 4-epimerase